MYRRLRIARIVCGAILMGAMHCDVGRFGEVCAAREPAIVAPAADGPAPLILRPTAFVPSFLCPCPTPYCKKALPAVPCLPPARCCDDYCRKPTPWWCTPSARLCDDYCKKPEPRRLPPAPCAECPNRHR